MTTTPPEGVNRAALEAEVGERIAAQVAASVARRQQRRQQRAQLAERRAAGLRRRHTAKLARRPGVLDRKEAGMSRNAYTPYRCCVCSKRIRCDRPFFHLRGQLYAHAACVERAGLVDHIERPAA